MNFIISVVHLSPEQIDATLMNLQAGLDLAFQRAKAWSKYLKDVMAYIERRAQLGIYAWLLEVVVFTYTY